MQPNKSIPKDMIGYIVSWDTRTAVELNEVDGLLLGAPSILTMRVYGYRWHLIR